MDGWGPMTIISQKTGELFRWRKHEETQERVEWFLFNRETDGRCPSLVGSWDELPNIASGNQAQNQINPALYY
jgi:hypothetical protein